MRQEVAKHRLPKLHSIVLILDPSKSLAAKPGPGNLTCPRLRKTIEIVLFTIQLLYLCWITYSILINCYLNKKKNTFYIVTSTFGKAKYNIPISDVIVIND